MWSVQLQNVIDLTRQNMIAYIFRELSQPYGDKSKKGMTLLLDQSKPNQRIELEFK